MHPAGREKHLNGVHLFERFEQIYPPQHGFEKTTSGRPQPFPRVPEDSSVACDFQKTCCRPF
jgi:hypothetical protein